MAKCNLMFTAIDGHSRYHSACFVGCECLTHSIKIVEETIEEKENAWEKIKDQLPEDAACEIVGWIEMLKQQEMEK